MTRPTCKNSSHLRSIALSLVIVVNVVSSWYPFMVDVPERRSNTARQQQDASWDVDAGSRVTGYASTHAAAAMANRQFRFSIEARPAFPDQAGPARLLAIGNSPYDASFMIGIERNEVVLRLPCTGEADGVGAEWRVPMQSWREIVVSVRFDPSAGGGLAPSIQVGSGPKSQLPNNCPGSTVPSLPDAGTPWTLGNVRSGHRPFVGRIVKLDLDEDGHRLDLLKDTQWQTPATFWMWSERVYQPAEDHVLAATWHFVSFVPLGFLAGMASPILGVPRALAGVLAFSGILNGGKLLIVGRHASLNDMLLNLAGTIAGLAAFQGRKLLLG
jgi:hypothetical protein